MLTIHPGRRTQSGQIELEQTHAENVRIRMSDGYQVCVTRYRPTVESRAVVVISHGIQSHAGWFEATSTDLANIGFDVWFADRRGSGKNESQRGHVRGAGRLVEDVRQIVECAKTQSANLPVIMVGLCWGGKIAAAAAADMRIPTDGLVLLYPGLYQRVKGSFRDRLRLHTGRFLGASKRLVPIPLAETLFTDDPRWQRFIRNDSLALREISVGSLFAARELDQLRAPHLIHCPTLLQLAGNDAIVHNSKVERWSKRITGERTMLTYDGIPHVLEFSSVRSQAVEDFSAWADNVIDRS